MNLVSVQVRDLYRDGASALEVGADALGAPVGTWDKRTTFHISETHDHTLEK